MPRPPTPIGRVPRSGYARFLRAPVTPSSHPAIDLRQLQYLVVVVEEGQITRAAHRLRVAQPALSQAISRLESQLGVRLLERLPRGIEPTPAGEAFFEKAREALSAVEEAEDVVHPWARSEARLALGFLPVLGPMARPWLRRFIADHPGVELETRHLSPQERIVELRRGRIDAELMFPPPRETDLEHLVVLRSPRFVLMHDGHPLAGERPWSTRRSRTSASPRGTRACRPTGRRRPG